ncbi:MAG: FxsA family protein [Thermoleophilaceae bacterium]
MLVAGLVALFIILPLAELYVIIAVVGEAIGPVWTIALLVLDSLLGAFLLKNQGRAVWRRFNEALAQNRMPHREVQDGVLVIFGGAFLVTPGFITDIIGLLLLIPFTRAPIRRLIMRAVGKRFVVGVAAATDRRARAPQRPFDVDGTAAEADSPRLER